MADDFRIDSHKLIFHPERVADWRAGHNIYPLSVEISLTRSCNHRCQFCAFDYLGYKPTFIEEKLMLVNLKQMADHGVKSVVFAGEGEPLLHKSYSKIVQKGKEFGLDLAMSSNGVLLNEEIINSCLPFLTWIRFSVNAGAAETYHKIHKGRNDDFKTVLTNLEKAVNFKRKNNLHVTLGVQILLIAENAAEILTLGKTVKEIGVDYYTVKPYSHHPKSINDVGVGINYGEFLDMEHQLRELCSDQFQVYFRMGSMQRLQQGRSYKQCLGLPFWTFIDSEANVWACSAYLGESQFCFGNLHEMSFAELWESEKRTQIMNHIRTMDITDCRELCRIDEINAYLNQLKHPGGHVNFI